MSDNYIVPYVEWMDNFGFFVREGWDFENNEPTYKDRLILTDFQRRILGHCLTPDEDGKLPYSTIVYSCRKKSGKTAIGGSIGAWWADQAPDFSEIYCIANSQDHAEGRIMRDIKYHMAQLGLKSTKYEIEMPNNTFVQALAKSYTTAAGARQSLVLWDEAWGLLTERDRRLWGEMTPIPTVKNSFKVVVTYAGFENESDLLWDLYLSGVGKDEHPEGQGKRIPGLEDLPVWENGSIFCYWDHEARMPWQTDEYYDEQMATLRPTDFMRLHLNEWVTSEEAFIPIELFDDAADAFHAPITMWDEHPYRSHPMFVGIDAGVKRDSTAVVCTTYDSDKGKVIVQNVKIWEPVGDKQVNLDEVEAYLLFLYNNFNVVRISYDPTYLMQMMQRLGNRGLPVHEFTQSVDNMIKASQNLFDLFRMRNIQAYPDDKLKEHLKMASAKTTSRGFRLVKSETHRRTHKIDAAIALAMSAYEAIESKGVDVSEPVKIESPFADISVWDDISEEEQKLPFPLRT